MKKIAVFSGSRSEYGLLKNLLNQIQFSKYLDLNLIVVGSHLAKNYGTTISEIKKDKIKISKIIKFKYEKNMSGPKNISKNVLILISHLSIYLKRTLPDVLILVGDRYETFIAAVTAVILKIKIVHIHGGEITHGSKDDLYRHSISKMSDYHFVSTKFYKKRLKQLGENPSNIFNVGALCNDNIRKLEILDKTKVERILKTKFYKHNILVSYHPETSSKKKNLSEINEFLRSLSNLKSYKFFFSAPNADENSEDIIKKIKLFCRKNKNTYYKTSYGNHLFLNLLIKCNLIIGNSSSGIIEAPLIGCRSINLGKRQLGRIKSNLTLNCNINSNQIIKNIKKILNIGNRKINIKKNPYYGFNVSNKIYLKLKNLDFSKKNYKKFYDVSFK
tara:strand:- start:3156 stop:4319 length:1164 start_codon:yes stop_codon:yes gene_type:complete